MEIESRNSRHHPNIKEFVIKDNDILLFSALFDDQSPLQWIENNQVNIEEGDFPLGDIKGDSIFEKIKNFYISQYANEDSYIDIIYQYKLSHGLHFAFRGVECKEIYIGKFKGNYQLSGENVHHEFNINTLIDLFKERLTVTGMLRT